jgi:hypothetical protein
VLVQKKIITVVLVLVGVLALNAQNPNAYKVGTIKSRVSISAVSSFYKNHPQHTINTKGSAGFCASYKGELLLGHRMSFLFGMDYLKQSFSFQGYFVAPGYTYLFDKTFAYTHEVSVKELQIPIGFKKAFNNEKDSKYTPYYFGGVGWRYILNSYYVITNDSTDDVVYDGKGTMDYEYQVFTRLLNGKGSSITRKLNAFIWFGMGTQYNLRDSGKALFFEINYKYGISRMHYTGYNNSNNLNIKDSHLLFTFGYKF